MLALVGATRKKHFDHLDDLDLITAFDGLGQALANLPAPGDHNAFIAFVEAAHFAHHGANVGLGGDEKYLIQPKHAG